MFDDKIPFKELPLFNNLIKEYLYNDSSDYKLPGYPTIDSFSSKHEGTCNRELLCKRLTEQNKTIKLDEKTNNNIDRLLEPNCYTITTGHQLCLMTGPMYFINKICSAIALTNLLNDRYKENHFVPVFWMASEDHDFEEVNHFHLFGKKYSWQNELGGAVGKMSTKGIEEIIEDISDSIGLNKSANDFLEIAKQAYQLPTLAEATRFLVNALFQDTGLVILDGDDAELKREMIPFFKKELIQQTSFKSVSNTNNVLKSTGYKVQVNPREINLFYLLENDRQRIIKEGNQYKVNNTSLSFSEEEILKELDNNPDKFSPNVILRPLYQEVILPNLAYIGGGGEISYWLQLEQMFIDFSITFPKLLVRDSALFIRKKTITVKEKNDLNWNDFFLNDDTLSKQVVQKDLDFDFSIYNTEITNFYHKLLENLDVSLQGTIASEQTKALKGIQNIEKKTIKNIKTKNEVNISRVLNAKKQLFPSGKLQERFTNHLELLATFEIPLIPLLIRTMNPLDKMFHFYTDE